MPTREEVTRLLQQFEAGDPQAVSLLTNLLHEELSRKAAQLVHAPIAPHTMTTRSLVNEVFIRLLDQRVSWQNRAHFIGVAAQCMRRILLDHARKHGAQKRGGNERKIALEDLSGQDEAGISLRPSFDVMALNIAMEKFERHDPRANEVIQRHFFAGRTFDEIAEEMHMSVATVKRDWEYARAWLKREMDRPEEANYGATENGQAAGAA